MIRIGNLIRLSPAEKEAFRFNAGSTVIPKTVTEFNRLLQQSAEAWEDGGTPEGKLLGFMNRIEQIDETTETATLVIDRLRKK